MNAVRTMEGADPVRRSGACYHLVTPIFPRLSLVVDHCRAMRIFSENNVGPLPLELEDIKERPSPGDTILALGVSQVEIPGLMDDAVPHLKRFPWYLDHASVKLHVTVLPGRIGDKEGVLCVFHRTSQFPREAENSLDLTVIEEQDLNLFIRCPPGLTRIC